MTFIIHHRIKNTHPVHILSFHHTSYIGIAKSWYYQVKSSLLFTDISGLPSSRHLLGLYLTLLSWVWSWHLFWQRIGREVTFHFWAQVHQSPFLVCHFPSKWPGALLGWEQCGEEHPHAGWDDAKSMGNQPSWFSTTKIWKLFVIHNNLINVGWYSKVNESEF